MKMFLRKKCLQTPFELTIDGNLALNILYLSILEVRTAVFTEIYHIKSSNLNIPRERENLKIHNVMEQF